MLRIFDVFHRAIEQTCKKSSDGREMSLDQRNKCVVLGQVNELSRQRFIAVLTPGA